MKTNKTFITLLLLLAPLVILLVSLFIGRYPKPLFMPFSILLNDQLGQNLVYNLRLPRLITAALLGMSLAAAGGVMQMLFRNPLVEPGFLGVTQGAGFGAALSILFLSTSPLVVELTAASFAVIGLVLSYFIARRIRFGGWVLRLILSGIAVSALFSAGLGILKYMADPTSQLPEIVFWLLGGLWSVTWTDLWYILPVVVIGLVIIFLMRWRLNLLSLSDETAFSLGVAVGRERTLLLAASVAVTAVVVSVAGIVGWIGLIIPHVARRIAGANAAAFIPVSMSLGAIFGIICDDLARVLTTGEIPLGIITSLIGAAIFLVMMTSRSMRIAR
ncbi:MAG TPA: iron ABC transporter permease [Anaerolineaceae bacterium]|nr:iron ABC transporter permease [Anaerolineaceae bacterium]